MILGLRVENGVKYKYREFKFEKGLTTISGPNGAGKSLIQEFIRFALFGSQALRGKVSDYSSNMRITLWIRIRDEVIKITRTLKDCNIEAPGGEEVRGTTTCNNWIVRKLGYDMSVFDIGNVAKQFEINKLGEMRPSERKNTIDQVIGLSAVSKLIKILKEEKNEIKNYIAGFTNALVKPIEPEEPNCYKKSEEIHKEYTEKYLRRDNLNFLVKKCEELKCEEVPDWEGDVPQGDLSKEVLYRHYQEEFKKLPENAKEGSLYTKEQLDQWLRASKEWSEWVAPEITLEVVNEEKKKWQNYKYWSSVKKIKCPVCGAEFTPNHEHYEEVAEPELSEAYLRTQEIRILTKPKTEKPEVLIGDSFVKDELQKIEYKKEYDFYTKELEELGKTDFEGLRKYQEWESKRKKYEEYKTYLDRLNEAEKEETLEDLEHKCKRLWDRYVDAKVYEENLRKYEIDKKQYDDAIESIQIRTIRQENLENAISGLTELISTVKNSIIPSLSSVATNLCQEMSNGELSKIEVSDDFEILVDGRELNLLSGSEKAVANLAIRLALSSVLTRKIFNVFMGDEIDEAMSEERANATAECLKRLTNQIEQIILISHRHIVGDNVIEV